MSRFLPLLFLLIFMPSTHARVAPICAQIMEGKTDWEFAGPESDWPKLVEEKLGIKHGSLRISVSRGQYRQAVGNFALFLDGRQLDYAHDYGDDWISAPWILHAGDPAWSDEQRHIFQALGEYLTTYAGFKHAPEVTRASLTKFDEKFLHGPWAALKLPTEELKTSNGDWLLKDKAWFRPDLARYFDSLIDTAPILPRATGRLDPHNLIQSLRLVGFDPDQLTYTRKVGTDQYGSKVSLNFFYGTYNLGYVYVWKGLESYHRNEWTSHSRIYDDHFRGRGIGQALYLITFYEFQQIYPGRPIYSEFGSRSVDATQMWERLLRAGLAGITAHNGYRSYTPSLRKIAALKDLSTLTTRARRP